MYGPETTDTLLLPEEFVNRICLNTIFVIKIAKLDFLYNGAYNAFFELVNW